MMKFSKTFHSFWQVPAAVVVAGVLAGGASTALAQTTGAPTQAQGAPLTLLLSGPGGKPSALVYSQDGGWRLHAGWDAAAPGAQSASAGTSTGFIRTGLKPPPIPAEVQAPVERPLTVFIDGPTGFTYIYGSDEGWKFVGQIANANRQ
ncbi:hypothetical protein QTI66_11295 [Variovorax sp. J22R133]|uniref:hypothetical protein n=1 Tax=Variovorax brevis TaxID=3053503 RepID=UPI00257785E3|nr:hypothetical protein [Variovorax sp. J22R133]MDM0112735.1 hypothetical protein [Variovorax sp. J22R133]